MDSPLVLLRIRALLVRVQSHDRDRDRAALTARLGWVEPELATRFLVLWAEATAA